MLNSVVRLLILILLVQGEGILHASLRPPQENQRKAAKRLQRADPAREIRSLFADVESALLNGDYGAISKYFAKQVYLSLHGTENGYYSSNQAYYILQNYFGGHRVTRFRFSTISDQESMPYATGGGSTVVRGASESLQIYVAAGKIEDHWVITQFNVY